MTKMKNLPDLPFCKIAVYKIALAFKFLDRIKWGVIYCVNLTGVDWVRHGGAFTFHCCRAGNLTAGHRTTTTMTRDRPSWEQNIKGEVLLGIIARNAKLISITCLFFSRNIMNIYMLVKITSNRAVGNLTNEYRRNRCSKLDRNIKFYILTFNRQRGKTQRKKQGQKTSKPVIHNPTLFIFLVRRDCHTLRFGLLRHSKRCLQCISHAHAPLPSNCRAALSLPGGWSFANFVQLGGRTFANPGAIPELLAHMCIPIQT